MSRLFRCTLVSHARHLFRSNDPLSSSHLLMVMSSSGPLHHKWGMLLTRSRKIGSLSFLVSPPDVTQHEVYRFGLSKASTRLHPLSWYLFPVHLHHSPRYPDVKTLPISLQTKGVAQNWHGVFGGPQLSDKWSRDKITRRRTAQQPFRWGWMCEMLHCCITF